MTIKSKINKNKMNIIKSYLDNKVGYEVHYLAAKRFMFIFLNDTPKLVLVLKGENSTISIINKQNKEQSIEDIDAEDIKILEEYASKNLNKIVSGD